MTALTLFDTSLDASGVLDGLDKLLRDFDGNDVEKLVAGLRKRADDREPIDPGFRSEVIYQAYPRKEGRGAALKAIAKALRKVDADELQAAVEEYARAVETWPAWERGKDDGSGHEARDLRPHPATWFNQERWLDDRTTWTRKPAAVESTSDRIKRLAAEQAEAKAPKPAGYIEQAGAGEIIDAEFEVIE